MQLTKTQRHINYTRSGRFTHEIGSTIYNVRVYSRESSKESLEDKMLRMMKSDLTRGRIYGKMAVPQAGSLPERGSV